ncbi:MAG TPA: RNA 3'-terminal phosphate cyclase [bacterium]
MIALDGSSGEGGGQILRSALTLSILTAQPFTIKNIRANRRRPGLQPQHLKSVEAAGAICRARISGHHLDSTQLTFEPGTVSAGEYRFDIGTAGATTLVLQTIFLPLSFAASSSRITITGGTHVPWSPCFDYLDLQWLPFMKRIGADAEIHLIEAGFYPKGGGKISAEIHPVKTITPLHILERGDMKVILGISAYANLQRQVAERQMQQTEILLKREGIEPIIEIKEWPAHGINTMMMLLGVFEHSLGCYFALGARGKPAEKVATEAADAFVGFMHRQGAFDEFLADQLVLPLALADGPSVFKTPKITQHLLTNIGVIRSFLDTQIAVEGNIGEEGMVWIGLRS